MRKKILAVLAAAGMLLLQGCGGSTVTESTIEIKSDGTILQTTIDTLDEESWYDSDEFKTYVEDEIEAFTEEETEGTVKLKSCSYSESDAAVTLVLTFSDADTYTAFEGCTLFIGTVEEAVSAGFAFAVTLVTPEELEALNEDSSDDASGDTSGDSSGDTSGNASENTESADAVLAALTGEEQIVILEENYNVIVPGDILYLSADGCSIEDDTVKIDAGHSGYTYIIYE